MAENTSIAVSYTAHKLANMLKDKTGLSMGEIVLRLLACEVLEDNEQLSANMALGNMYASMMDRQLNMGNDLMDAVIAIKCLSQEDRNALFEILTGSKI